MFKDVQEISMSLTGYKLVSVHRTIFRYHAYGLSYDFGQCLKRCIVLRQP
jgi:hypothetical protein